MVNSLSGQVDKIVAASPGLAPSLVRSKGRALLVDAVKSYDPSFGASLSTHAHNHLKPLSTRGYTMARAAPRSRYREDIARSIHNEMMAAEQMGEEEPNAKELAAKLKLPIGTVENFLSGIVYEAPEGSTDITATKAGAEDARNLDFWTEMVYQDMSPAHRKIFDLRSGKDGKDLTLGQVAEQTGVSPSMVHKITTEASKKILKGMASSPKEVDDIGEEPEQEPTEAADFLNERLH